jgi:hypothetical protein
MEEATIQSPILGQVLPQQVLHQREAVIQPSGLGAKWWFLVDLIPFITV